MLKYQFWFIRFVICAGIIGTTVWGNKLYLGLVFIFALLASFCSNCRTNVLFYPKRGNMLFWVSFLFGVPPLECPNCKFHLDLYEENEKEGEDQESSSGGVDMYNIDLSYYWRPIVLFFVFWLIALVIMRTVFSGTHIIFEVANSLVAGIWGVGVGGLWHNIKKGKSIPALIIAGLIIMPSLVSAISISHLVEYRKSLDSVRTLCADDINEIIVLAPNSSVSMTDRSSIKTLVDCMANAETIYINHQIPEKSFKLVLKMKNGKSIQFTGKYFSDLVINTKSPRSFIDILIPGGKSCLEYYTKNCKSLK